MDTEQGTEPRPAVEPDRWVDLYADQLYSYALQMLRDPAAAEDAVQETFLAALGSKDSFQGRSQERTWLFGILKHKIIDTFRRSKRQPAYEDDNPGEMEASSLFTDDGSWKVPPGRWNAKAEELFERREFFETLKRCLDELSEGLAKVFALRELQGASSKSVCEALGISANNLWVRMYRARASIRKCLETQWFEPEP